MKTYKNLYPTLCSFENLEIAFRKARRGKRSKANVAAFEGNLDLELLSLQDDLLDGSYRPGGYRHFTIYEGKPRRISAAPFRDRVVHHAFCPETACRSRTVGRCSTEKMIRPVPSHRRPVGRGATPP